MIEFGGMWIASTLFLEFKRHNIIKKNGTNMIIFPICQDMDNPASSAFVIR